LPDFGSLFAQIRARYDALPEGSNSRADLLAHVRSLARFLDEPMDYPEPGRITFPGQMPVAYAVCHPECGAAEFIVDGSTQECQLCGGLLFRMKVRTYSLSEPDSTAASVAAAT
jgi:hypothetical protein